MRGDFSRLTFDPGKRFSRVLMQQGRVQLDADWNEQVDIVLHSLRGLARDLIGPHGGGGNAFKIDAAGGAGAEAANLTIGRGRYYVDGILCEYAADDPDLTYTAQEGGFPTLADVQKLNPGGAFLVYLDVWERHVVAAEDDDIRETALGGPDTTTRTKVIWQVRLTHQGPVAADTHAVVNLTADVPDGKASWQAYFADDKAWDRWLEMLQPRNHGALKARARKDASKATDPCLSAAEAQYRGQENQLYRVEVVTSGKADEAQFVWSRDNGAVTFPIRGGNGKVVTLDHLGRDSRFGLKANDLVEVVDDADVLAGKARKIFEVAAVDDLDLRVTLEDDLDRTLASGSALHPLLRRWDREDSDARTYPLPVIEPERQDDWVTLEDGVQIQFQKSTTNVAHEYRAGDYWLIPARFATGDVEWPRVPGSTDPRAIRPRGVTHHYAPLAMVTLDADGKPSLVLNGDCRRTIRLALAP